MKRATFLFFYHRYDFVVQVARNQKLIESRHLRCSPQFFATDAEAAAIPASLEIILALLPRCCFAPLPPTRLVFFIPGLRSQVMQFPELERITFDPMIMGGKPCIRGMRITVGTIVGLVASGASFEEVLQLYPYLESEDIRAAVAYAAWRSEERETPLQTA
jgi:uncharacterized protein (DUF433 family)